MPKKGYSTALIFAVMVLTTAILAILRGNNVIVCSWAWVFSPIWIPVVEAIQCVILKKWFDKD